MSAAAAALPDLRSATLEELAALYAAAGFDSETGQQVLLEAARRDRAERSRRTWRARVDSSGWTEASHAQYLMASEACAGRLLSAEGMAAVAAEWPSLWNMPRRDAARYASEELRNFWEHSPRLTLAEYLRQQREAERIARDDDDLAAMAATETTETAETADSTEGQADDGMERDVTSGLRLTADGQGSQASGGRAGQPVLRPHPDTGAEAEAAAAGDGGAGGLVQPAGDRDRAGHAGEQLSLMVSLNYREVHPQLTRWLWPGRLAYGHVTLLAGEGGAGKGMTAIDLAARVTRGLPMPGETEPTEPGSVLLVTPEDSVTETVTYRLRAARADIGKVADLTVTAEGSPFTLPDHVGILRQAIEELGDVRLVIIDPLMSAVSHAITSNLGARRVIQPLQRLAAETGAAVLVTHHVVKSGSVAGNRGLTDACRIVLRAERDRENPAEVVLRTTKANIASTAGEMRYAITGSGTLARIQWIDRAAVMARRAGRAPLTLVRSAPQRPHVRPQRSAVITSRPAATAPAQRRTARAVTIPRQQTPAGTRVTTSGRSAVTYRSA